MGRLRIFDDTIAHICWDYLHGTLDEVTNEKIYDAVHQAVGQTDAIIYVFEIAYHIGYAKSLLIDVISETTYKKKKKTVRDRIALLGRGEAYAIAKR